jgi:hypothetical protein
MEPIHVYAALHLQATESSRRAQLERYHVTRDHARRIRRERRRAVWHWFVGRSAPAPTVELAV